MKKVEQIQKVDIMDNIEQIELIGGIELANVIKLI